MRICSWISTSVSSSGSSSGTGTGSLSSRNRSRTSSIAGLRGKCALYSARRAKEKPGTKPGSFLLLPNRSGVLADAGQQPGLVLALLAFHAPAFAEGFALIKARGLAHAAEGQGGHGHVRVVVHTIEHHVQVVDVSGLETVTQGLAFASQELPHLRGHEFGDLVHFRRVPVLLQIQEVGAGLLQEALLVEPGGRIDDRRRAGGAADGLTEDIGRAALNGGLTVHHRRRARSGVLRHGLAA